MENRSDLPHLFVSVTYLNRAHLSPNAFLIWILFIAVGELCHLFTNYIVKNGVPPIQGVRILAQAVDKIRLFDSQLTSVHADLCQLSLCAKIFNPVLNFLEVDITSIFITEDSNHDAKYFLLYYYYGGMIYSSLKNYERALYFFEVAVSTSIGHVAHYVRIIQKIYSRFVNFTRKGKRSLFIIGILLILNSVLINSSIAGYSHTKIFIAHYQ